MNDTEFINLPEVGSAAVEYDYFPTKMQAVIFRNWEMVPKQRIAECLKADVQDIEKQAEKMGLEAQGDVSDWLFKGYISIIRANWNLLCYDQLLLLLGWEKEKLAFVLKEEDFLDVKLDIERKKPYCEEILYRELTEDEEEKTKKIKEWISESFFKIKGEKKPFDFYSSFSEEKYQNICTDKDKVKVTDDWSLNDKTDNPYVKKMAERFRKRLENQFGITLSEKSDKKITLELIDKENSPEYHEIKIEDNNIIIKGADSTAILRGLLFLEDKAGETGAFAFSKNTYKRKARFKTRFMYSFSGLYNDALDVDSREYCPDELLLEYSRVGVNGIWIQGILYKLCRFPFEPEISDGYEKRLENLKSFSERAMSYGIKIYLYLNEPRSMPVEFFEKYPELKGNTKGNYACLCTSTKPVQKYLYDGIKSICEKVPELGGFFTITMSENATNCHSIPMEMTCPRCKKRKASDVVSEVNNIITSAAKSVNPGIKLIAWDWSWQLYENGMNDDEIKECIESLDKNAILMSNRETLLPTKRGGIRGEVMDYSISVPGISEIAKKEWEIAKNTNHEIAAKVQINNSWECSTIPYLPVYSLLRENIKNLICENVSHVMLGWTLGGYPSPNIKMISDLFFEDQANDENKTEMQIYKTLYKEDAQKVYEATEIFSDAFLEFPFNIKTLYVGPQNGGISNPLFLKPTGKHATMTCYAFDELSEWQSIYPADIFENQFMTLCSKWELGLKRLEDTDCSELKDIALAVYIQFKSSYNQIRFIRARDRYIENKSEDDKKIMKKTAEEETELAKKMHIIMQKNPCIGFEAANHYYYTKQMIKEKLINCKYIISML